MSYPFVTANGDGNATAAFVSATQSSGLNITSLGALAQLQLAVANLMLGEPPTGIVPAANVTAGTFGAGAFTFQGALTAGAISGTTGTFSAAAGTANVVAVTNTTGTSTTLYANPIFKVVSGASGADTSVQFTDAVTANGFISWKSSVFSISPSGGTTAVTFANTGVNIATDFSVATSKFTVAAATGNTVVAGTASIAGTTCIGGASTVNNALRIAGAITSGNVSQRGVSSQVTVGSDATFSGTAIYATLTLPDVSFTMANGYGLYVDDFTKGASATLTNQYGVYIATPTNGGALNIGIYNGGTLSQQGAATFASTVAVAGGFGCNGATPQTKTTLNAASTDLASVIALCNQIRTTIIANGQSQ